MRGAQAWQLEVRPSGDPATLVIALGGRWRIDRRLLAETLEQQPAAIWRGKRQKSPP